jgi:hypothetical protein
LCLFVWRLSIQRTTQINQVCPDFCVNGRRVAHTIGVPHSIASWAIEWGRDGGWPTLWIESRTMVAPPLRSWQGWVTRHRFCAPATRTLAKIEKKIRYMHGNPVKRGLVRTPEQWRWSSARAYILGEAGPVRLNERQRVELKWSDPQSKTTPEPVWEAEPECPPSEKRGGWGNHGGVVRR